MNRAVGIGAIGNRWSETEGAFRQIKNVGDTSVGNDVGRQAGAPDGQIEVVAWSQLARLLFAGLRNAGEIRGRGTAGDDWRNIGVDGLVPRADFKSRPVHGAVLSR